MGVSVPVSDHADPSGQYPDIRDIVERVGRGLMQLCALSHKIAFTTRPDDQPLTDLADLRQIRSAVLDVADDAAPCIAQVGGHAGNIWAWYRFLNEPESASQIRPADVAQTDPGMWVQQKLPDVAACATHRYLAHIEYLSDRITNLQLIDRCRGKFPALFISPMGGEPTERSQTLAFHEMVFRYQLRFISANWRGGVSARFTPPLVDQAPQDPGNQRAIGDIRRVFIHDNTLQKTMGVTKISLGADRPIFEADAERIQIDAMDIRVITYVNTPNTPCDFVAPWKMWVQLQDLIGFKAGPPNEIPAAGDQ